MEKTHHQNRIKSTPFRASIKKMQVFDQMMSFTCSCDHLIKHSIGWLIVIDKSILIDNVLSEATNRLLIS